MKMENIAKKKIESFVGLTDIFLNEVEPTSNGDGFTHSPQGFKYNLYNGSGVISLAGDEDNIRGKRTNLNIYDESGFITENYAVTTEGFCLQNANFKMGGDVDTRLEPEMLPNQLLYCSSASSEDSYFYKVYREYSKKMLAGSNEHFVADLDCEVIIGATNHGVQLPVPLLSREKVEQALKVNKEKAMREYYNNFASDGGANQPIKRAVVLKNSKVYRPILGNEDNKNHRFIFAYDPARSYDNSVVVVAELFYDAQIGLKAKVCNCVSLADIGKKKKTPMRTPEQIDHIKQMFLDYNGTGFGDYENIEKILIDSGSGGAGVTIGDYFMEEWKDKDGHTHSGLIDLVEQKDYESAYPTNIDKLMLVSPNKYKTAIFDALVEMIGIGAIEFTSDYDNKGYLQIENVIESDTGKKDDDIVEYKKVKLNMEEEFALSSLDLLKEELFNVYRFDNGNTHNYNLPRDKRNDKDGHLDRAYALGLIAWYLQKLRSKDMVSQEVKKSDLMDYCLF